jgi:hypothetical protein
MKKAIEYLKTLGIKADSSGNIISKLPDGLKGIELVNMLEENTMTGDFCYTIINNKIEKIDC